MADNLDQRRREYLERIGIGPVMAARIIENVRWRNLMPHDWAGGLGDRRCVQCEMTYIEAHRDWPGEGTAPCLNMPVRG